MCIMCHVNQVRGTCYVFNLSCPAWQGNLQCVSCVMSSLVREHAMCFMSSLAGEHVICVMCYVQPGMGIWKVCQALYSAWQGNVQCVSCVMYSLAGELAMSVM